MHNLNVPKTAVAVGAAVGAWHALWAVLVAVGLGQRFADYVLRLHFISLPLKIAPFDWPTAAALVGVTSLLGLAAGGLLAAIWNGLHASRPGAGRGDVRKSRLREPNRERRLMRNRTP